MGIRQRPGIIPALGESIGNLTRQHQQRDDQEDPLQREEKHECYCETESDEDEDQQDPVSVNQQLDDVRDEKGEHGDQNIGQKRRTSKIPGPLCPSHGHCQ